MEISVTRIPGAYEVALHKVMSVYTVTYGKQIKTFRAHKDAWKEYLECIDHALACAGWKDDDHSA